MIPPDAASGFIAAVAASPIPRQLTRLSGVDILVIAIYFAVVVLIGFYLKKSSNTATGFFLAGREMTAWIAGLSFISANLGSLEMMGYAGATYEYGILAAQYYWIGAIPAILFLGIVMMPFYYISKTNSVPGYLSLRYGPATRALSGISFAVMTILMSGINMYAMALVMKVVLGWNLNFSIWISSLTVAIYVALGGLKSAIYNEVLQFLLIWAGALLVPILGLIEVGGWVNLRAQIVHNLGSGYVHLWSGLGSFQSNPMGINWFGMAFGVGFVTAFAYWTTDFLVVQRVLSANSLRSARMAPIIGGAFKMVVPFIVILPGLLALVVLPFPLVGQNIAIHTGQHSYNEVLPLMLVRYCGPGLLGLGVTALIAGFMSGMAGNVSAFSTVWTSDLYGAFLNKTASERHYVHMGRWSALIGVLISVAAAYLVEHMTSIMDYAQALFSIFVAPLFGTVILGMFWKRATPAGGFWGLLAGTCTSFGLWEWARLDPSAIRYVALSPDAKVMAQDAYRMIWAWAVCVIVTVVVSYATRPRPVAELKDLVYGISPLPVEQDEHWYQKPIVWAAVVAAVLVALNVIFW